MGKKDYGFKFLNLKKGESFYGEDGSYGYKDKDGSGQYFGNNGSYGYSDKDGTSQYFDHDVCNDDDSDYDNDDDEEYDDGDTSLASAITDLGDAIVDLIKLFKK